MSISKLDLHIATLDSAIIAAVNDMHRDCAQWKYVLEQQGHSAQFIHEDVNRKRNVHWVAINEMRDRKRALQQQRAKLQVKATLALIK
jgi:hypothetical protein